MTDPHPCNDEPGGLTAAAAEILQDFALPAVSTAGLSISSAAKDILADKVRHAWAHAGESRCEFEWRPQLVSTAGIFTLTLWPKSIKGRLLTDIKEDADEVEHFASTMSKFLTDMLGENISNGTWALCTSPRRRHKERNFATMVSERIGELTSLKFYPDVAICHNRQRVNAEFELNNLPSEPNLIIYDDIITTGSTLRAMQLLLRDQGKTVVLCASIKNR